jgi:pimeloyl-ACP methyl ester carboxylesterase
MSRQRIARGGSRRVAGDDARRRLRKDHPGAAMMLAWLGELIDQTCMTPSVMVGTSLGGSIAARSAADHSVRLARPVLVDAGGLVGRVIEDAGHLAMAERPDAFLEALPAAPGNR